MHLSKHTSGGEYKERFLNGKEKDKVIFCSSVNKKIRIEHSVWAVGNSYFFYVSQTQYGYVKTLRQAVENALEVLTDLLKKGNNEVIGDVMRLTAWLEKIKAEES